MRVRRIGAAVLLAFALSPLPAHGEGVFFPPLAEEVPGQTGTTYLDLARMIIPDLKENDGAYVGGSPVPMRSIDGADEGGSPPTETMVYDPAVLDIATAGKDRMLLLMDLGSGGESAEGFAVLALFTLSPEPKLLDAVNVAVDQATYFRDPGKLQVGAGEDIVMTMSTHFNSSQGYVSTGLMMIRDDRLELIDRIFTLDERGCGYERRQEPAFETRPAAPYASILATVTDTISATDEDCSEQQPPEGIVSIAVTYRWDIKAGRYTPSSDAYDRLAQENAKRF